MTEPITSPAFREALAHFASGVTIVTARDGEKLYGISVLGERQAWVAEQFARKNIDRFEGMPLVAGERVPLVEGALVHLECRRYARHEAGDHTILIGEVLAGGVTPGKPLLHFARKFGTFGADAPRAQGAEVASAPDGGGS
jgi:flavin reductase (DIM6/NTAB) family NADH-FMN oxidoreductase RutF